MKIPADLEALNARIVAEMNTYPNAWAFPPPLLRELRQQGKGIFPMQKLLPAESKTIPRQDGDIALRIFRPNQPPGGVYLHFHSGGWMLGTNDMQDEELIRIVHNCGLAVVSVEYRLAPEDPYPAGPDDCETAALWLARESKKEFGTDRLAIGGESAGAHLSVLTLLRLRDTHRLTPFVAVNLNAGCYDLSMTPSVRNWGDERLVLTTRDVENFVARFVPNHNLKDPAISPFYADLKNMPPALFSVGTRDLLHDDSVMMFEHWRAAGNEAEIAVTSGGCHVFQRFFTPSGIACMKRQENFLKKFFA